MDSFENGFSSPNRKLSASSKSSFSGETKENDVNHDLMGSDFKTQSPKKPVNKHFMSPTISAISKVTVSRKKILADKNISLISCNDAHSPKSPVLESRNGLLHSGSGTSGCDRTSSHAISPRNYTSETDVDDELKTCFVDSSLKPYDPLPNYLSPRPKYLRYKPNRRREILERGGIINFDDQKIVDEENFLECDQEESLVPPLQEGSSRITMVKVEDSHNDGQVTHDEDEEGESEEVEEAKSWSLRGLVHNDGQVTDDEDEEGESEAVEEAKSWSLRGLVTLLLLLIAVGQSISYIASINSPRPSPAVQAIGGLIEGYHRIQKHLFETVYTNVRRDAWRNGSGEQPGDGRIALLGFNLNGDHEFGRVRIDLDDEEELEDITDEIIEMPEPPNGELEEISEADERDENLFGVECKNAENKDINDEMKEIEEEFDHFPVRESVQTDAAIDQEMNKVAESSEGLQQCASIKRSECFCGRMDNTENASGNEPANLNYKGDQLENDPNADQFDSNTGEKEEEEMAVTRLGRSEDASTSRKGEIYPKVEEVGVISVEKSGDETDENKMQIFEATGRRVEDENVLPAKMENDDDALPDATTVEIDLKLMKDLRYMDLGPITMSAIWFSVFSIVWASLVYIYLQRAIPTPVQDSQLELSDRREKLVQTQFCDEVEYMEERAESIVKPSSVSFSFGEAATDFTSIHAPDVELLGEFVIGKFGSSIRNCSQKARMSETQESNNPIFHAKSKAHPVAQPQILKFSSTDSPSYGSFTAEKIIFKNEGGRDGNLKEVTTPVRRSGRIRNLSVTSP